MSVVTVYATTEVCKTEKMFGAKHDSVVDQCLPRDALIVLGYFNAATGIERAMKYVLFILRN